MKPSMVATIVPALLLAGCTYTAQQVPPGEYVGDYDEPIRVTTTAGEQANLVRAYATRDSLFGRHQESLVRSGDRIAFAVEEIETVEVRRDHSTAIVAGFAAGMVLTCLFEDGCIWQRF